MLNFVNITLSADWEPVYWCEQKFSEKYKLLLVFVFVTLRKCSLKWRRHHCRWRAANVDLCSALISTEQWEFFSVTDLLWSGASVYNDHLRWHVTLTHVVVTEHISSISFPWTFLLRQATLCKCMKFWSCLGLSLIQKKIVNKALILILN